MPIVSVIIPIYNVEKYLRECIESVLVQTYTDFELILVDDGSPDNCGKICDEYAAKDNRIRVIHKENGGVSSARNCGIDNAKGSQIMFVDGDDTVEPDYIQNLLIIGDEDMVQGGCKVLENDFLKPLMTHDEIISDFGRYWNESGTFSVCWQCFKKSFLDKERLRFEEDIDFAEDERFIILCLQKVNILRRTETYNYCYNTDIESSATKKLRLNRMDIEKDFCQRMEVVIIQYEQIMRLRYLRWHYAFNHYYRFYAMPEYRERKRDIKKVIVQTYNNSFFRQSIPFIRKNGTLDEKIESYLMGYYRHKLYKHILSVVQFLSKCKHYRVRED